MNQRRVIFMSIFGLYHLFTLLFVVYIENQKDLGKLIDLYQKISWFKYGAILGLILFSVELGWTFWDQYQARKKQEGLRLENNTLKAQVYDFQQAAKKQAEQSSSAK